MEGDIVEMGKFIGAGLATIGMGGAAIGVGSIVGNFLSGALRTLRPLVAKQLCFSSASHLPKLSGFSRSSLHCC